MSEKVTKTTTVYRRESLAKITSGVITQLPKITQIALGDGGCDAAGELLEVTGRETGLKHEVCRCPVTRTKYPAADIVDATGEDGPPIRTAVDYVLVIPAADHAGAKFSEAGIFDEQGNLCGIMNMYPKQKDGDVKFTFYYRDEF